MRRQTLNVTIQHCQAELVEAFYIVKLINQYFNSILCEKSLWSKTENPLSKEWIYYILFRFECNLSRKENCQINGDDREILVFLLLVFGRLLLHLPAHKAFCI